MQLIRTILFRLLVLKHWLMLRRWWLAAVVLACGLTLSVPPAYAIMASKGKVYQVPTVPKRDIAIVFGAGISNGIPSTYLESRLLTAISLYKHGKVRVLLMSGDNSKNWYDEPTAMKQYVVAHGVPAGAVVLDYAGFDTYDTCYRAHALFGVRSAILVSHAYHLPRALLTCNALGINSVGVGAVRTSSSYSENYLIREVFSLNKAAVQLTFKVRPEVLGPQEKGVTLALRQKN